MSCWEVKDYLSELVAFKEEENELILPLCRSSLNEVEARLRADANRDDVRVSAAAAAIAYYKLMLRRSNDESGDSITDFKAGDVSITQEKGDISKQLEKAEKYRDSMLNDIIPLCEDNNFAFRQVEVKL